MVDRLPDSVFRAIFDRTGVPFVVVDLGGTVVDAGEALPALLGWARADVVGRNITEFLDPGDIEAALGGLAEIDSVDRVDASVPIVVPIRTPDGSSRQIEVAAVPLHDVADRELIALRLRSWEAQHHLAHFVRAMLADTALDEVLASLARSVAASMEGVGAAVHHGFDGIAFAGVSGSWPGAADLPLSGAPWADAVLADGLVEVPAEHGAVRAVGATTGWLVPVRPQHGVALALLSIWRRQRDVPSLGHRRAVPGAVDSVELALVRSAEHERLLHLAGHDPLTGVANRATFRDRVAAALARGETDLAVGFCDLDDFKRVNDRFGHAVGDEILVEVVERIRRTLRTGDEIARIGGDEFTILWRGIPDAATAQTVVDRVVATGSAPFPVPGGVVQVGVSIGYVLARPGATAESLVALADAALYESKDAGGGRATERRSDRSTPPS